MVKNDQKQAILEPYIEIIRDCRTDRGLSQMKLAAAAGCSDKYVALLETGKRIPTIETVVGLAAAAGAQRDTMRQMFEEFCDQFEWTD